MYELALAYLHARNHERPYEQRNSAAVSQPILTQLIFTLNLLLIILRPPLSDQSRQLTSQTLTDIMLKLQLLT